MRFAVLLALTLTAIEAQTIAVRNWQQAAPLDGEWRISTGDDPRFAAPDFDDSAWRTVRVPDEEIPRDIYWIRFRVQFPDPSPAEPLALLLPPIAGSYDVFVNGRRVGSYGNPRTANRWGERIPTPAAFAIPSGPGPVTIAIRCGFERFTLFPALRAARGAWIGTAAVIEGKQRQAELETRWTTMGQVAMMSATAMASLFFLLLPIWRRDAWEYFWCGLFLMASTLNRPLAGAPWMLEGWATPLISSVYGCVACLSLHSWERLFHHLLGVPLTAWKRRCQQGMLAYTATVAILALVRVDQAAAIAPVTGLLSAGILGLVYLDRTRRSPAQEETGWMHAAAAMYLVGIGTYFLFRSRSVSGFLPNSVDAAEIAGATRSLGVLLFAGVMAMVLNRRAARLQREQERLSLEMRAGAEMQSLLLPADVAEGVEAIYLPASEVGGDFYQVLDRGGARVVLVGDVSGKGLKAAMLVSVAVGILRNEKSPSPSRILAALNDGLVERSGGGFATCCCARFDPDGTVTIANAGHPAPYCDGREVPVEPGLPLGVVAGVAYREFIARGDRFTFVSDGVVEAENAQRELFGFERTRAISGQSAREIAEAAKAWGQNDDITVVTVRRIGA